MVQQKRNTVKSTEVRIDWPPLPPSLRDTPDVQDWYDGLKITVQSAVNNATQPQTDTPSSMATKRTENLKK